MSKETFSKTISELMYHKIKSIEYHVPNDFFQKDIYFEFILCLTYLTLTKEKIIKKEIKNNDRLGRLTLKVDESEVNKVFHPNFCSEIPTIISSRENNPTWILDNIRDSIMHGAFEIDEEKQWLIINNTQFNRELEAIVPFSWVVAYAKNDILKQRVAEVYNIKGFFYNKLKLKQNIFFTKKELSQDILYNIKIEGEPFNIYDIKKDITDFLYKYSKIEIPIKEKNKYFILAMDNNKENYEVEYLAQFYYATDQLTIYLKNKYPNNNIQISIYEKKYKYRLIEKMIKKMPKYFKNYDLLYETFNKTISGKGINLLHCLMNIIENLRNPNQVSYNEMNEVEIMNLFNGIFDNDSSKYKSFSDVKLLFNQNLKIYRSLCISCLGISTLVINHENLYNPTFLNMNPTDFHIDAYNKQKFMDYVTKRRTLIMDLLDIEMKLYEKNSQLEECKSAIGIKKINQSIQELSFKKNNLLQELSKIDSMIQIKFESQSDSKKTKEVAKLDKILSDYYSHFCKTKDVKTKRKIKKIIGKLIDTKNKICSSYMYAYCNTMEEVLTIMRDSFAHIGRINIGKDRGADTFVVFNDYDSDDTKSGKVIIPYIYLLEFINMPFLDNEQKRILNK